MPKRLLYSNWKTQNSSWKTLESFNRQYCQLFQINLTWILVRIQILVKAYLYFMEFWSNSFQNRLIGWFYSKSSNWKIGNIRKMSPYSDLKNNRNGRLNIDVKFITIFDNQPDVKCQKNNAICLFIIELSFEIWLR